MTFRETLESLGGFWQYKIGNRYLAQLASGKISDTFVNCGVLTTRPGSLEPWAEVLSGMVVSDSTIQRLPDNPSRMIEGRMQKLPANLHVVGPGMGGITLAYEMARWLGAAAMFTEPVELMGEKHQKFRFDLPTSPAVMICEDVITTGGSVHRTLAAVCEKHPRHIIAPVVACLVDRRAEKGPLDLGGKKLKVVSLLEVSARTWDTLEEAKVDCPSVIEAIKPKANWSKLVEG